MSNPPAEPAEHGVGALSDRILRNWGSMARTVTIYAPNELLNTLPPVNATPAPPHEACGDGGFTVVAFVRLTALLSDTTNPSVDFEPYDRLLHIATRHRDTLTVRVLEDDGDDLPRNPFTLVERSEGEPRLFAPVGAAAPLTVDQCRFQIEAFDQLAWSAHDSLTFLAELTVRNLADIETSAQAAALSRSLGLSRETSERGNEPRS